MAEQVEATTEEARAPGALRFFLVALLLLAFGAWERDLFDADEGRYATVAWHMVQTGDWVTPRLNGMPFMDKPPLVYWVQATLTAAFGRHEIIARTPTLLAGCLWALFIFLFARHWTGSNRGAWFAGLLAVTSAAGMIGSRVGPQMDMPLAAAMAAALYAGWLGIVRGGRGPALALGAAVGLGLLIKGPLAAAVPMLVAASWILAGLEPRRVLRTMFSPLAWGTALVIAAPWYVLVERAQPGWIMHFIRYEHLGRFNEGDFRSFRPLWFYVPVVLIYLSPWASLAWSGWGTAATSGSWTSRVLGLFTWSPWSQRPWGDAMPSPQPGARAGRTVTAGRLAWWWFIAAFVLYSLATRKLLNYLLPAAAPLFVLLGAQLDRRLRDGLSLPWRVPLLIGGMFIAVGAFTLAGLWLPLQTGTLPTDLEVPRWQGLGAWLLVAGIVFTGAVLATLLLRKRAPRLRVTLLLLGAAVGWWTVDHGMAVGGHLGSSKRLAVALEALASPDRPIVCFKRYPQGLGFYDGPRTWMAGGSPEAPAQREIVVRYARPFWQRAGGPAPEPGHPLLLDDAAWRARWEASEPLIAVIRWREVAPLGAYVLSGPYAGAGRTDLYIVSNVPDQR